MSNNTNLFAGLDRLRDREILALALSNLAELLESPSSADREHLGGAMADAWIARCGQLQSVLFLLASRETYVIQSASELAASDGAGFWSNTDGWTSIDGATRFTFAEKRNFNQLPISTGSDAEWALWSEIQQESTKESSVIKTSLFRAIKNSDFVVCDDYEIDGIVFDTPGYVRLDCGEDVIAVLKEQDIEIDQFGECKLTIPEDDVAEAHAHEIEVGGKVILSFRVRIPVRGEDLVEA